jgi:hypothetical protein
VKVSLSFDAFFHPAAGILRLGTNHEWHAVVFARANSRERIIQKRPPVDRRIEPASQERVGHFVLYLHQILPRKRPKRGGDIVGITDTGRLGDGEPLVLLTHRELRGSHGPTLHDGAVKQATGKGRCHKRAGIDRTRG